MAPLPLRVRQTNHHKEVYVLSAQYPKREVIINAPRKNPIASWLERLCAC